MSRSFAPSPKTREFWPKFARRRAAGAPSATRPLLALAATRAPPAAAVRVISLRLQLALAAGAMVFVVAALLGGLLSQNAAVQMRIRAGEILQNDALRIADQLNRQMAARARELFLLGSLDPMYSLQDSRQVQALLTELRSNVPAYYWIGLTDATGHMIASTSPELLGGDFSARPEIHEALRGYSTGNEGAVVRGTGPSPTEPLPMTLSHPVRAATGGIGGVVVAQLRWAWVRDLADRVLGQEDDTSPRSFVLINDQDHVLLGPPDTVGTTLILAATARARGGYVGWSTETWPDGKTYLTGAAIVQDQIPTSGPEAVPMHWTVVTREDAGRASQAIRTLRLQVAIGGVVLAIIAACLTWMGAGLITNPLRRIAEAAGQISRGEATALPRVERPAEIRSLANALGLMLNALGTHQVALDTMETMARHDPLTGLLNREGLRAWLTERMAAERSTAGSLMVFLADLDGFKPVNDLHGHQAGDIALVEVAARMARFMRPQDAVARFGGDEFLIILDAPRSTADEAAETAIFDLFDAVCLVPYQLAPGLTVPIGISLGGALWPDDGDDIDVVIGKADAALYAAKRAGKGRIIMHQPEDTRNDDRAGYSAP